MSSYTQLFLQRAGTRVEGNLESRFLGIKGASGKLKTPVNS